MALAAMVAGSVFVSDVVAPEYAEAARSGGRMGGSSFRSAPRMAPRGGMGGQSRQAPPPGAMRGGMGMGMPMIMPMPMFSPFGFGFGFGGLSFIFNILEIRNLQIPPTRWYTTSRAPWRCGPGCTTR